MKYLSSDELDRMLRITRRSRLRNRDRLCLLLMGRLGLRASEVCGIRMDHVRHELQLIELVGCKHGSDRIVPITPEVGEALALWLDDPRRVESEWLIPTRTGGQLHRNQLGRMVRATGERAKLERPVHPHMLRHTAAVALLDRPGAVLTDVQALLGHKRVSTTSVYLHARPERLAGLLQ